MDASRYFDAMHNAMSTQHVGAQLLLNRPFAGYLRQRCLS